MKLIRYYIRKGINKMGKFIIVITFLCMHMQALATHEQKDDGGPSKIRKIDISYKDDDDNPPIKLTFSSNTHLDNVNFLLAFPNLTDLDISFCKNLGDSYQPISQLTNLERLDIYATGLTTTQYLAPLVKLQYLRIY